jgi:hypothetical protein
MKNNDAIARPRGTVVQVEFKRKVLSLINAQENPILNVTAVADGQDAKNASVGHSLEALALEPFPGTEPISTCRTEPFDG